MTTLATNDALDEIEARWKSVFGCGEVLSDIRTLIGMVRARDRVVEAARKLIHGEVEVKPKPTIEELEALLNGEPGKIRPAPDGSVFVKPTWDKLEAALDALDTPPAQEQK